MQKDHSVNILTSKGRVRINAVWLFFSSMSQSGEFLQESASFSETSAISVPLLYPEINAPKIFSVNLK